jgi:hypothetical protein
VGHGERFAERKAFPLDFRRFCLEKKPDDTCRGTDAQPPDVAFDQSSPQASAKEPSSDVVDETEHLGPSNLENRGPFAPASSAMQVRGHDRERSPDDTGGGEAAFLVSDGLLGGGPKRAES